jgi:hypothetical protein
MRYQAWLKPVRRQGIRVDDRLVGDALFALLVVASGFDLAW